MLSSNLLRSTPRVALRAPLLSVRHTSGTAGSVTSSKMFQARERGQEDWFIRQAEKEKLLALKSKAQAEIAAKQLEIDEIDKQHKALGEEIESSEPPIPKEDK
ncbi:hypothetical protein BDY24DRAFT_416912 [Mrakia frigida]|uniref:uncharacterized protein n=1 Tax=Mrakia frigida TaxID=29902 RepID=UPI003FCC1B55